MLLAEIALQFICNYLCCVIIICGFTEMLRHTSLATVPHTCGKKGKTKGEYEEKKREGYTYQNYFYYVRVCNFKQCETDSSISHNISEMADLFTKRYRCHANVFTLLSVPPLGPWGGEKALGQQHDNTFTCSLIHHQNIMV